MILNQRQFEVTSKWLSEFQEALRVLHVDNEDNRSMHPILLKCQKDAVQSQIEIFEFEIREWLDRQDTAVIGKHLFAIHTRAEIIAFDNNPDEIVYREKDLLNFLNSYGFKITAADIKG